MGLRQALQLIMTGESFTGRQAAEMGLIKRSVPKEELRDAVVALARNLLEKNPVVLRYAKQGFKRARELTWEQGEDYLYAKTDQSNYRDPEKGRKEGLKQFLDDKTIKPGLQAYKRG
jgi:trans-feruloyl-CoA hydratase/vanillin synthase